MSKTVQCVVTHGKFHERVASEGGRFTEIVRTKGAIVSVSEATARNLADQLQPYVPPPSPPPAAAPVKVETVDNKKEPPVATTPNPQTKT